jgi:hypothetical protein
MFTEVELNEYAKELQQLGITEETKQKEVLECFYQIGKIIYEFNINNYGEEN